MADQSDVETALVSAIAATLYPQGPSAPSLITAPCRIYRGAPTSAALTADLAGGVVNVTITPEASGQENTTRYPDDPQLGTPVLPALTVAVAGQTATFAGSASLGQVAGLVVDNMAVVHRTQAGDSPALVAATLASYLRTRRLALVSGATLTVPDATTLIGRVVADQVAYRETRRQRQHFKVSVWCPSADLRDRVATVVDQSLAASLWLPLADGAAGYMRATASVVLEQSQVANLYRRDLTYSIEYPTIVATTLPAMIFGDLRLTPADAGSVQTLLA